MIPDRFTPTAESPHDDRLIDENQSTALLHAHTDLQKRK